MASAMGIVEHYADDNTEPDIDTGRKLHGLRVLLQTRMIDHIPQLKQVGGIRAIPFMQVRILSLWCCVFLQCFIK